MSDGRGEGQRGGRSVSVPPPRSLAPPMQRPPAASTISSPSLLINSLSSPKWPPYLISPSSSVLVSVLASALASALAAVSESYLCVCTPYVAFAVSLIPVLAVIVNIYPPCNYFHRPRPFSPLVMGSVTWVNFLPEAAERLVVKQKQSGWKTLVSRTIDTDLVRKLEGAGLLLILVSMYPLPTGELKIRVLIINKDVRKSLARKSGNENPIWSWNDSYQTMHCFF